MLFRRPGRYLKTFLEPVASFSQSMSPFRATATPFIHKITKDHRTIISQITIFPNSFSISDFWAGTLSGLDPSQQMHIDCPQLQTGVCGGLSLIRDYFWWAMPWPWPAMCDKFRTPLLGCREMSHVTLKRQRGLPSCSQEAGRSPTLVSEMWEKMDNHFKR